MAKRERGISLIELILAIGAIVVLAVIVSSLPSSIQSIRRSGNTSLAREIVSKQLDFFRKQPYESLSNGTNSFNDTDLLKLPSSVAEYEIDDCPIDICSSGEEVKKIKVKISWQEQGEVKELGIITFITEGGLGQ